MVSSHHSVTLMDKWLTPGCPVLRSYTMAVSYAKTFMAFFFFLGNRKHRRLYEIAVKSRKGLTGPVVQISLN